MLIFLKVLLLIALAPVVAVLVVVNIVLFVVLTIVQKIMKLTAIALGVCGIILVIVYFCAHPSGQDASTIRLIIIGIFAAAAVLSPYGIPLLLKLIVKLLDSLTENAKSLYSLDFVLSRTPEEMCAAHGIKLTHLGSMEDFMAKQQQIEQNAHPIREE